VSSDSIKLNFAKAGADTIAFSGTLPIPAGFVATGAKVYFDVGGVVEIATLNASGSAKSGGNSVKIAIKSKNGMVAAQTSRYMVSFTKGSFVTTLAGAGLANTSERNQIVPVKFTFIFNDTVYQKTQSLLYSAALNRSGSAR
jgi:hypothetical protein